MRTEADVAVGSLSTHDEFRYEQVGEDPLAPARGVMIGLLLSALLWVLVAFLAIHL